MTSQTNPVPGISDEEMPGTARMRAKAVRRTELLAAAARQMAQRGFAGVRLEDIGAEVGVSGPAMYRHFSSKTDLLDHMLLDISERLCRGGREVVVAGGSPAQVLRRLIEFHIDVLVTNPDLISIQDRDLASMTPEANRTVRSLQRQYVEQWVAVLHELSAPVLTREQARLRVHAGFGLLNSSPRLPSCSPSELRDTLTTMSLAALLAEIDQR